MKLFRPRLHRRRAFAMLGRRRRAVVAAATLALGAMVVAIALSPATADASTHSWWWWHHHRHHHHHTPPPPPNPSPSPSPDPTDTMPPPAPQPPPPPPGPQPPPGGVVGLPWDPAKVPTKYFFAGFNFDNVHPTNEEAATQGVDDTGAFRTVCKPSHMLPDDPIVRPGLPGASHLHTFFGNSLTNANSTADSLRTTGNGTCRGGTINRTGYWVPTLIDTKTGTPIAPDLIHVYYKSGYIIRPPSRIQAMPPGLRMVAGDATASGKQEHTDWSCFDGGGGNDHSATIHQCDGPLSMNVEFPQCWDGKRLDSPDHKSHMAYAVEGENRCPDGFPVAIPVISFHVLYNTQGRDISGWRLSSDTYDKSKPGGFSAHGDWFYGWKPEIVNSWIPYCVQRIASCGSHLIGGGRAMNTDPF